MNNGRSQREDTDSSPSLDHDRWTLQQFTNMSEEQLLFRKYCEPHTFEEDKFYIDMFIRKLGPDYADPNYPQIANQQLDHLTDIMSRFITRSKDEKARLGITLLYDIKQTQPTVNFCMRKLTKYLNSYCAFVDDFFLKAAHLVSILIQELGELLRQNVRASCQAAKVENHFMSLFVSTPWVMKIVPKITGLHSFIERYRSSVRMPTIPTEHLRRAMKESAACADESIEYSKYGFYDDFMFCFVMSRQDFLDEIDELVKDIIAQGNGELTDFRRVESLVAKIVKSLKPIDKKDVFVVRCGVVRIFFDRLYVISENYLRTGSCSERFTTACQIIRNLTPRVMGVSDYLMSAEMIETRFLDIVAKEKILQQSLNDIQMIQFYTNPLDIMACVLRTLKSLEKFVRQNLANPDADGNVASQMSFDDFFPLFCLIFSIDPPVNAYDVSHLLSSAVGLITSSAMEFAKMFFTSSVEYIEHSEDEPFSAPKEEAAELKSAASPDPELPEAQEKH